MTAKEQINVIGTQSEYGPAQVVTGGVETRGVRSRVLSAVHARQGVVSGRVATVLAVSVTLALVGMVLAFVLA
jgi:hypothetical protein